MPGTSANDNIVEITEELWRLAISCSKSVAELHTKKVKLEKLRRCIDQGKVKLIGIKRKIKALKIKRDKVTFTERPPVLDKNGVVIELGATVVIENQYTSFSTRFTKSR